ncbi:hypothetical protein HC891_22105, partial [Candidatus Gracilibacteria bacterium]|nr:hypothetical protein [Candidatus Gracilibacteria bacterium]
MNTPRLPHLSVLATLLALLTALFAVVFARPAEQRIAVGAPGDAYFLANFYRAEQEGATSFRWSAPDAQLLLPGTYSGAYALRMRLRSNVFATEDEWRLSMVRAEEQLGTFQTRPEWRQYHVLLPPGGRTNTLRLDAPTKQPTGDPRFLGVALSTVRLQALPHGFSLASLQAALLIGWMLGLATAAWWLIDRSLVAGGRAQGGARPAELLGARSGTFWRTLLWLLALGSGGLTWAWLAPGWFAAFVAPGALALVAATALLAAVWWTHQRPLRTQHAAPLRVWVVVFVVAHGLLVPGLPLWLRGFGALLLLGLPGALAALLLFRDECDALVRAFLALATALALPTLLIMGLHALPGPLEWWLTLLAFDALSIVLLFVFARQKALLEHTQSYPHPYLALGGVLLLGAVLRLSFLGASEFQGDEAWAMLAAQGVRFGRDEVLLLRPKGPAEVLLPAGPLLLLGTVDELIARLPFALAGLCVVLGTYLLGTALAQAFFLASKNPKIPNLSPGLYRLCGEQTAALPAAPRAAETQGLTPQYVGLLAALIVALDGYPIAFSRIVQYQSVVMLMMVAALWCCWRFYAGAERPLRYLLA